MPAQTPRFAPWIMLIARPVTFISIQALFALGYFLSGASSAWERGADWWPITVGIADVILLFVLIRLFRAEGKNFWEIFRIERAHLKTDLLTLLGLTILTGPVSMLPNVWLGGLLFGDPQVTLDMIVRPMPFGAVYVAIFLFGLGQAITELPAYFIYSSPRLAAQGVNRWLALVLPALFLGLQHIGAPLLFDWRFIVWRALMFIPFALVVGAPLIWRPRLMPYLALVHGLMDAYFAVMFLSVAY